MALYTNPARALRHLKRGQAAYLYGRFPQRHILGMPCCSTGFLAQGQAHTSTCVAALKRYQGIITQIQGRLLLACEDRRSPQKPYPTHADT